MFSWNNGGVLDCVADDAISPCLICIAFGNLRYRQTTINIHPVPDVCVGVHLGAMFITVSLLRSPLCKHK